LKALCHHVLRIVAGGFLIGVGFLIGAGFGGFFPQTVGATNGSGCARGGLILIICTSPRGR
jgi:hypothetical protein